MMHLAQAAEEAADCSQSRSARASAVQNASADGLPELARPSRKAAISFSRASISCAFAGISHALPDAAASACSVIVGDVLSVSAYQILIMPALFLKIFVDVIARRGRREQAGPARLSIRIGGLYRLLHVGGLK